MENNFSQGLVLMCVGMGTVLVFLVVLLGVTRALSLVVPKLSFILPDPVPADAKKKAPAAGADDEAIAVAIAVAMKRAGK